jgi:hypothetical protein
MYAFARPRRIAALILTTLGLLWLAPTASAQEAKAKQNGNPQPRNPTPTTELKVSPAAAPLPIFRYRLHPVAGKLMPGNAAPVYLRLRHEFTGEAWKQIREKVPAWLKMPLDEFPIKETHAFINNFRDRLKLLEIGTRRESCDWGYTLAEQRTDAINILLPDAQDMRQWGYLIALKAREEMAEGDLDEAVHTLGTGIAFGRHVGEGPFYINGLVGMAICQSMFVQLEELVSLPDAPNLYWALTAIPRPLVPLRKQMEIEQRLAENMIPEMNDVFASHPPAEWTVLAEKMYAGMLRLARMAGQANAIPTEIRRQFPDDYASYKKLYLDTLRVTLRKTLPKSKGTVSAMSDDEVMARGIVNEYRIMRDAAYKVAYLPYVDAIKRYSESEAANREAKEGPAAVFSIMQAAMSSATSAEIRLERRIAMLRTIEAIRLYAAAHDGKLPESLDAITEVPIPLDPATNQPFPFTREGDVAVVTTPEAGLPSPWPIFRISVRK